MRLALVAVVLLLLPALPWGPAEAQSRSDPWWGPGDRASPTAGWAVRVPVVVENPRDWCMGCPPAGGASLGVVVAADVDFGRLLVDAGWTNRTAGAEATLRGFTLDVDSIRVVEYGLGFAPGPIDGPATKPLPHAFYPAPFEGARHRDFDPARNPSGTVLFHVQGQLAAHQKRFFYVYASPLEYGKTPPAEPSLAQQAPLDAFLWGSSGTLTYGYHPLQGGQSHAIEILPLDRQKTRVEVSAYDGSRFAPIPATPTQRNPVDISPCGGPASDGCGAETFFVPAGKAFRVVSDRPVIVNDHGNLSGLQYVPGGSGPGAFQGAEETHGFVPALNGSYAGRSFWFHNVHDHAGAPQQQTVSVIKAGPGTIHVRHGTPGSATTSAQDLTSSNPVVTIPLSQAAQYNRWTAIETDGDVLVTTQPLRPDASPFPLIAVPALTGGPVGDDFFVAMPQDGGFLRVCPSEPAQARLVAADRPGYTLVPGSEGPFDATPPARLPATGGCEVLRAAATTPAQALELYTLKSDGASRPARVSVMQGSGARDQPANERGMIGHFAGKGAADFHTTGPIGILAYYDDTRVTWQAEVVRQGAKSWANQSAFAASADGFRAIDPAAIPGATGELRLVSSKPIAVVSIQPAFAHYSHFVPGRPENPDVTLGAAEFRGPLVELRSREKDGRQDFRSTGPGTPVAFPLEVANLGRWIAGEGLPETIAISCAGPEGWVVEGCPREARLGTGQAERLDVRITPPADALHVNGTFVVEARSKAGGVSSQLKLIVFVEIRYGVGMWFDVEGGRKTIDPPVGVDPGETHRYGILVKNTGSARDTFDLAVEEPRPGWTQELLLDGEAVRDIALDGGESRLVTLAVTAPHAEAAPQNIVRIDAQSRSSALAADVVNTATRIRPKVNVELRVDPSTRVAEPNATAAFNLTVENHGNDIFRVSFRQEGLLPEGWNATLGVEEIDLGPGEPFSFPLLVVPPADARAGDLATLKIAAETDAGGGALVPGDQVSAVVVVRRVHNVTAPSLLDATAAPGSTFGYAVALENHGNGNDVVELLPGSVTPAWKVEAKVPSLAVDVDATEDMPLSVTVPPGTPPGLHNLTMTLRLTREATQNVTIPVNVLAVPRVVLEGAEQAALSPGQARILDAIARNAGNVAGTFELNSTAPEGWTVSLSPERVRLAPGEWAPVRVALRAPREASDGDVPFSLTATLDGAEAGATPIVASLARPELRIERVEPQGSAAPGDLLLVTASVSNKGGIAAENVSVALVVDGATVDRIVLSRIPTGETKAATLSWLATKRADDVRVVLDPDEEIVQPARERHEVAVATARALPAPGPSLALALALALALVLRRRA